MIKRVAVASLATIGLLGLALVVGAQRPGPGLRQDFGLGGGPGGWGGPPCTSGCPQYQYTYTRTVTQPVFSKGVLTTTTNTTTGTIASYSDGSSYRDGTMSAVVPGSHGGPQKFIDVRDMGAMTNYVVHGSTYEKFPIKLPPANANGTPHPNWKPGGPGKGPAGGSGVQPTSTSINLPDGAPCTAEETTITRGDSTTHRIYCPALHLLVEEDRSDRFGQSNYTLGLSAGVAPTTFPYTPTGTLVTRGRFPRGGGPGPGQGQ